MRSFLVTLVILMGANAGALECRSGELMLSIAPTSDGRFEARSVTSTAGDEYSYESLKKRMPSFSDEQVRALADKMKSFGNSDFGRCSTLNTCDFSGTDATLATCTGSKENTNERLTVVAGANRASLLVTCETESSFQSMSNGVSVRRQTSSKSTWDVKVPVANCK